MSCLIANKYNKRITALDFEISELAKERHDLLIQREELKEKLDQQENTSSVLKTEIEKLEKQNIKLNQEKERLEKIKTPSRGISSTNSNIFTATAYDLSVQSCGKAKDHPQYGITASGKSLVGHTWKSAKAIAVDPRIIPMGSKVEVTFLDENYSKYDAIYTAVDTGSAIKGNKIDIFLGEDISVSETMKFGNPKAKVKIVK